MTVPDRLPELERLFRATLAQHARQQNVHDLDRGGSQVGYSAGYDGGYLLKFRRLDPQ